MVVSHEEGGESWEGRGRVLGVWKFQELLAGAYKAASDGQLGIGLRLLGKIWNGFPPCDGEMDKRMPYRGNGIIEDQSLVGVPGLVQWRCPWSHAGPRSPGRAGRVPHDHLSNVTSAREPI